MEQNLKVVNEAVNAIHHVVNAFSYLRKENPPLNELLESFESILANATATASSTHQKQHSDCENENLAAPNLAKNPLILFSRGKKRKVENSEMYLDSDAGPSVKKAVCRRHCCLLQEPEQEEEKTPEEKTFGIDLLLEHILTSLSPSDLKSCRGVNFSWNRISTKLLLKRNALKIEFNSFNETTSTFSASKNSQWNKAQELTSLLHILGNSEKRGFIFPCNDFTFINGNLGGRDLQSFLSKYGTLIRRLSIDINQDTLDHYQCQAEFLKLFKKMLVTDLPNVEELMLGKLSTLWDEEEDLSQLFPEPKALVCRSKSSTDILSKLKLLHFAVCTPAPKKIFRDLLSMAKNIQSLALGKCSMEMIPLLCDIQKVNLLTSLEITLDQSNADAFEAFAERQDVIVNLKRLMISVDWDYSRVQFYNKVASVVSTFLKTSCDTLEEFHSQPLGSFNLQIPVLRKLKLIRILNDERVESKLFSSDLKFSHVFPCLESLESAVYYGIDDICYESGVNWEDSFGASNNDSLPSMKHINFSCGPPLPWIQNFAHMFHNLTSLRIGFVDDFTSASKTFWKLKRLESLEFIILLNSQNAYPAIDMGFTGFSKRTCLQLCETAREVDISDLEDLRENPSILDVKCLRKLHLMFYDPMIDSRSGLTFPIVSHVTGLFAFQMCPQIKVTLSVGISDFSNKPIVMNGLSPILPFVDGVTKARNPYGDVCMQ